MSQPMSTPCLACGGRATFAVLLPALSAPKKAREKEAAAPLVWKCGCGQVTPLVLTRHEAV